MRTSFRCTHQCRNVIYYLETSLVPDSDTRSKIEHNRNTKRYIALSSSATTWEHDIAVRIGLWRVSWFPQAFPTVASIQGRDFRKNVIPQPVRGTQLVCWLPHVIKSPYRPHNLLPLLKPACQTQQRAVWWRFGNAMVRTHGLSPGMYTPMPLSIQALTNQALIFTRANFNVSWVHNLITMTSSQRSSICAIMP